MRYMPLYLYIYYILYLSPLQVLLDKSIIAFVDKILPNLKTQNISHNIKIE